LSIFFLPTATLQFPFGDKLSILWIYLNKLTSTNGTLEFTCVTTLKNKQKYQRKPTKDHPNDFFQTGDWICKAPSSACQWGWLTCAEPTVHALPATVRQLPANSLTFRWFQVPRLPGEWWMSKGNSTKQNKKMNGWMEDKMMEDKSLRFRRGWLCHSLSLALQVYDLEKGSMLWLMVWWW